MTTYVLSRAGLQALHSYIALMVLALSLSLSQQLFFVDVPPTASTSAGLAEELEAEEEDDDASSEDGLDSDADSVEGAGRALAEQAKKPALRSRNLRQAAWFDPADEHLQISLVGQKRLRKLRDGEGEDVVNGLEYETRLRRQ